MDRSEQKLDILITGGTLLTMAAPADIIEEPMIGIRKGKIIFVEKRNPSSGNSPEAARGHRRLGLPHPAGAGKHPHPSPDDSLPGSCR